MVVRRPALVLVCIGGSVAAAEAFAVAADGCGGDGVESDLAIR